MTLLALAVSLAGCETKPVSQTVDRVDAQSDRLSGMTARMREQKAPERPSVSFTRDQWVSTQPLVVKKGLPPARDCAVVYNESKTLQQFAQWVSDTCGVAVQIAPDALDRGASYLRNHGSAQTSARIVAPPVAVPISPSPSGDQLADLFPGYSGTGATSGYNSGTSTYANAASLRTANALKYSGSLSGLLDAMTGSLGLSWKYDSTSSSIRIFYLETRQFPLYAFNRRYTVTSELKQGLSSSAGVSSGGQGSSGTTSGTSGESGSNTSARSTTELSLLSDIEQNVRSMAPLGLVSYSKATGVFLITDRPDVLDQVQKYLDSENERITKLILVNVEVLSVKLSDTNQYGIDWTLAYKTMQGTWGFGLRNTVSGIDPAAIGGSISILDTASSPWAGSKALIQALSQQGRVSSYKAPSVTTLNLQNVPIQIGRVQGYLKSSQTTQSANVGTSTALQDGTITSGFNMMIVPMVMPNNELIMQLQLNMSTDPVFKTITSGGSQIQSPDYDIQLMDQSAKLRSGQTLVLSGFDQINENATKSGLGNVNNFLFGGGGNRTTSRDVLVLVITPVIMD
jgi:type IVB pilus formation R64 PilN family outer membrane protein